jgi:hypothetical protein
MSKSEEFNLADEMRAVVLRKEKSHERRMQGGIGPSELGHSCDRYLAYRALRIKPRENNRSSWLATLGTAAHGWLEKAFEAENTRLERERYVTEVRVRITGSIWGTVDLYDKDTETIIDHKVLGNSSYHEIKMGRIPVKYRTQLHVYGLGVEKEGAPVKQVALAAYPRTDDLDGTFSNKPLIVWSEPYSESLARDALKRFGSIISLSESLESKDGRIPLDLVEISDAVDCTFCPFLTPGHGPADETGCPGKSFGKLNDTKTFLGLK